MAKKRGRTAKSAKAPRPLRFNMVFSKANPRDVELHALIAGDTESGSVNVSGVLKDLAWEWYQLRKILGCTPAPRSVVWSMFAGGNGSNGLALPQMPDLSLGVDGTVTEDVVAEAAEPEYLDLKNPLVAQLDALSFEEFD